VLSHDGYAAQLSRSAARRGKNHVAAKRCTIEFLCRKKLCAVCGILLLAFPETGRFTRSIVRSLLLCPGIEQVILSNAQF
jgi:ribosomal protein L37E